MAAMEAAQNYTAPSHPLTKQKLGGARLSYILTFVAFFPFTLFPHLSTAPPPPAWP